MLNLGLGISTTIAPHISSRQDRLERIAFPIDAVFVGPAEPVRFRLQDRTREALSATEGLSRTITIISGKPGAGEGNRTLVVSLGMMP